MDDRTTGRHVIEESSSSEARRIRQEIALEREWWQHAAARSLGELAEAAFELAQAVEAWAIRSQERFIASGIEPAAPGRLAELLSALERLAAEVNAELN